MVNNTYIHKHNLFFQKRVFKGIETLETIVFLKYIDADNKELKNVLK